MRELIFLLLELSMFGTAYQIMSVLLVSLFLSRILELLILVSFKVMMFNEPIIGQLLVLLK